MFKKVYQVIIFNYGMKIVDQKYTRYEDAFQRVTFINTVYKQHAEIKKIIYFKKALTN